jgi:DNA-binding CsgD family transcriptional regulator
MRAEEIYDAAIDDGAFEQLAAGMAKSIGARSGVIHWYDSDQDVAHGSFSGYFSDAQMAMFDREFSDDDLWAEAVSQPAHLNRAWNCAFLVPPSAYENSRIYNEWIRPMGDDTFHCLGVAIRTERGAGNIGFHRGRTQSPFDAEAIHAVQDRLVHLRRMIGLRSKLVGERRRTSGATDALDAVGHAVFALRTSGHLVHCNRSADLFLQKKDALVVRGGRLEARLPKDDALLTAAIGKAAGAIEPVASALFVHGSDGRAYELSIAAVSSNLQQRQVVIVLTDPDARDLTLQGRLRVLYGLTPAEADIAIRLSEGASIEQLSDERSVSITTLRGQVKTAFAKLDCSRQSQLVAIVKQLPPLASRQ